MLQEFYGCIYYVPEPRSLACDETMKVIQQQKAVIDLIEAERKIVRYMICLEKELYAKLVPTPMMTARTQVCAII